MNLLSKVLILLLLTTNAYAESWVCFDESADNKVVKILRGDGVALGLCDENNSNIISNCILATKTEVQEAKKQYMKVDKAVISGSRVVDMTQAEKDAVIQAEQAAIDLAETENANNLEITIKDAFLAWLKVYNSKIPAQYRVTPLELKQQVLTDKGL